MKCKDCKYCAFVNEKEEPVTITCNSIESECFSVTGAYCMVLNMSLIGVDECSAYEKSKHRKIKPFK